MISSPSELIRQSIKTSPQPSQVSADAYEKTEMLGHGHFGEVWRGRAAGGVEVAIKIVTQPIDRDAAQRELQSLELVKNLRHPCLLATHRFWIENDRLHIAMELADGSLRDRLKQSRKQNLPGIPRNELLMYFADAAEGLDFLHTRKVFHRDIKPDNVLLLHGHAKVADFGLARLQEQQMMTVSFAGTPVYMAPETWGGKGGPRSDQYSLAFAYVELRQGKRPIEGADFTEVMSKTIEGQLDLSGIPPEEAKILRQALAKDPEERFTNCSEFVAALARATGTPVRLRTHAEADLRRPDGDSGSTSVTYKESYNESEAKPKKRAKGLLLAAGAVAIGLIGFAIWFFAFSSDPSPKPTGEIAKAKDPPAAEPMIVPKKVDEEKKEVKTGDGPVLPSNRFVGVAGSKIVPVGNKTYFERIEYALENGEKAAFVLIVPPAPGKPFYFMQDKVSINLFREYAQASRSRELPAVNDKDYRGQSPVTRINAVEAFAFAQWLGGKLPTAQQWDEAAGLRDQSGHAGPTWGGSAAVGRSEPRGINDAIHDIGPRQIYDLAGNGREWTRDILLPDGSTKPGPLERPSATDLVVLRGRNFTLAKPLTYSDLEYESKTPQTQYYLKASPYTTFRVVLEIGE